MAAHAALACTSATHPIMLPCAGLRLQNATLWVQGAQPAPCFRAAAQQATGSSTLGEQAPALWRGVPLALTLAAGWRALWHMPSPYASSAAVTAAADGASSTSGRGGDSSGSAGSRHLYSRQPGTTPTLAASAAASDAASEPLLRPRPRQLRGTGRLPPEHVEQLRRELLAAGMTPPVAANVLSKARTSDLRRGSHALEVWNLLRGMLGAGVANRLLSGAGAYTTLAYPPEAMAAKLQALGQQLGLEGAALGRLVSHVPALLNAPSTDLEARIERYAELLGVADTAEAVAWLLKNPSLVPHPMHEPQQRLADLSALLHTSTEQVQEMLSRCGALAAYPLGNLAAKMEQLPQVLGTSREELLACIVSSPAILTVALPTAQARRDALAAIAARSAPWRAQWALVSPQCLGIMLSYSERRHQRFGRVLAAGLDARMSLSRVMTLTDAVFEERLAALQAGKHSSSSALPQGAV